MTASKHTPGPWSVTDNSWEISSIYDANGGLVAECRIYDGLDEETQAKYEPIKEANARLIAAAPDLLDALRLAFMHTPVGSEASAAVMAAIAKAEGK